MVARWPREVAPGSEERWMANSQAARMLRRWWRASTALTALIFVLLMFGIINQVTTTSRQLWSFARDGGLPWSPWLSRVHSSMCKAYIDRDVTL